MGRIDRPPPGPAVNASASWSTKEEATRRAEATKKSLTVLFFSAQERVRARTCQARGILEEMDAFRLLIAEFRKNFKWLFAIGLRADISVQVAGVCLTILQQNNIVVLL